VTKVVSGHRKKVTVKSCTTKLVSGTVKFTTAMRTARASLARAGVIYATGRALRTAKGDWQLRLRYLRRVLPGRYTLTLQARVRGHLITEQRTIHLN
jgi:hypothetical protein